MHIEFVLSKVATYHKLRSSGAPYIALVVKNRTWPNLVTNAIRNKRVFVEQMLTRSMSFDNQSWQNKKAVETNPQMCIYMYA